MLYISLIFILAGMSLITAAGVYITYMIIVAGERIDIRHREKWPPLFKKWLKHGGAGIASTIAGMLLAMIAT
ncbi:MAG: hypothetical protein ACOY31_12640 [Bacillota bacterium]